MWLAILLRLNPCILCSLLKWGQSKFALWVLRCSRGIRGNSMPNLRPKAVFGRCPLWWFMFLGFFFYQKLCKYAVNIFGKGFAQIRNALLQFFIFLKTVLLYLYRMLPSISKVMPGTVWLGFWLIIKKKFSSQMNPND